MGLNEADQNIPPEAGFVRAEHPDVKDSVVDFPADAFEEHWKAKGWKLVKGKDQQTDPVDPNEASDPQNIRGERDDTPHKK